MAGAFAGAAFLATACFAAGFADAVAGALTAAFAAAFLAAGLGAAAAVSAGAGAAAERIIQAGLDHGVPLQHDGPLADALSRLPVDSEIPPELYRAVAEVLIWAHGVEILTRAERAAQGR